ncbi:hypothetical protein ACLK17_00275 [Escherichia coli]
MGVGRTFAEAFAKAQLGSNSTMKKHGRALLSVREGDKERVVDLAENRETGLRAGCYRRHGDCAGRSGH